MKLSTRNDIPNIVCTEVRGTSLAIVTPDFEGITTTMTPAEVARRLAACWNACEGVDTADLERGALGFVRSSRAGLGEPIIGKKISVPAGVAEMIDYLQGLHAGPYAPGMKKIDAEFDGRSTSFPLEETHGTQLEDGPLLKTFSFDAAQSSASMSTKHQETREQALQHRPMEFSLESLFLYVTTLRKNMESRTEQLADEISELRRAVKHMKDGTEP